MRLNDRFMRVSFCTELDQLKTNDESGDTEDHIWAHIHAPKKRLKDGTAR